MSESDVREILNSKMFEITALQEACATKDARIKELDFVCRMLTDTVEKLTAELKNRYEAEKQGDMFGDVAKQCRHDCQGC